MKLVQSSGFQSGFDAVDAARTASGIREFNSLDDFILAVLAIVGSLVAIVALVALVIGAVMYITSLGNDEKVEKAKKIIIYAVIGLLVLGVAGILVNVVINIISGP
jgi:hypothetical protein